MSVVTLQPHRAPHAHRSALSTSIATLLRAAVTLIPLWAAACSDDDDEGPDDAVLTPVFLSQADGATEIGRRDEYVAAMSRFDLQSRTGSLEPITVDEYLAAMPAHVHTFSADERQQVTAALQTVQEQMVAMGLALPAKPTEIKFVRTDGQEEGNADAYTRGDTIFLCDAVFTQRVVTVTHVVAHELFHLWSRANPDAIRWPTHEALGFFRAPGSSFPASLADRRVANPDDPLVDETIRVQLDGAPAELFLALVARSDYEGGAPFDYVELLLVEPASGATHGPESVQGLIEQVGTTTPNVISAEEISAEHFAIGLLQDMPVNDPALIEAVLKPFARD